MGRYPWSGVLIVAGILFALLGWITHVAPLIILGILGMIVGITWLLAFKVDSPGQDRTDINQRHNDRAKGLEPHRPKVDAQGNRQVRRHYADKFGFRHIQPSPGNIHVPHRAYDTHGMQDGLKGDAFVETGENHVMDARSRNRNGADD